MVFRLAGAITMFLPMLIVPVVSLLTTPPPKALVDKAFTDGVEEGQTEKEGAVV